MLSDGDAAFVAAYDRHLGNGTRAWLELHPDVTIESAATCAWRVLRNVEVRKAVQANREARWKRLKMDGDEVLAYAALHVRADIADLFDENGALLKPHLWPDDVRAAVEGVDFDKNKVKLAGKGAAVRALLEQTGKISGLGEVGGALAKLLSDRFDQHQAKQ